MDKKYSIYDNLERILQDEAAEPCAIPLQYLREITSDFSVDQELGNGGFGVVYKGALPSRKMIAVKNLRSIPQCHESQFKKELDNLMRVRHKNIVRLVGYCCETQKIYQNFNGENVLAEMTKMLLCFEYMSGGSLDKHLSDESCGLDWHQRYEIIKGICYGLRYLHDECQTDGSIIHLDLKPENVLLDQNFVPKIADFGLAKLFDHKKTETFMTLCAGSLGYMSPEYIYHHIVSPMADIYSLGVLILQIITGHKYGPSGIEEFCGDFVEPVLQNWKKRLEAIAKNMSATLENMSLQTAYQQIEICLKLGINCIQYDRKKRPTIEQIVKMLDRFEGTHSYHRDEGRPCENQVVQRYRERTYGEHSTFRRLFINGAGDDGGWTHMKLDHPSTFATLAMDPEKKQRIIEDLVTFRDGRDYYVSVGKVWKRGYLLYGPRGSGKSTMIAAMANFLDYDIYDLDLTAVKSYTQLRRLFIETAGKSILIVRDIDCSVDLTGKRGNKETPDGKDDNDNGSKVPLSALLNTNHGLWSAGGDGRIIVFTTNDLHRIDPAIIRRGRMDLYIEMSYCCFEGFKVLAQNYLGVTEHHLFDEIRRMLEEVAILPADVADDLMATTKTKNVDSILENLVERLKHLCIAG